MLRPPPRSTSFPYTTLFRSTRAVTRDATAGVVHVAQAGLGAGITRFGQRPPDHAGALVGTGLEGGQPVAERRVPILRFKRSEEHTSELQSLRHLVCRLLLEK